MKSFLRNYVNVLLAVFGLLLFGAIIGYFIWGIGYMVFEVNGANHSQVAAAPPPSFNLQSAANLNYRGLMLPAVSSTGQ